MKIILDKPGCYVLAVSGGVDSMVLLDLLTRSANDGQKLVIAHLDHGIRQDAYLDRELVQAKAASLGLTFEYREANLGCSASEERARFSRYQFLEEIKAKYKATAIVTAHHQDDLIETAIINMIRGTGRKGLTSLKSRQDVIRPLIGLAKSDIISYAVTNNLEWHEDSTNQDLDYLRNYVRHKLISRINSSARSQLIEIINRLNSLNYEIDRLVSDMLDTQTEPNQLGRQWFSQLPHSLAREVIAVWLRQNNIRGFDRKTIERLVVSAKVAQNGRAFPVLGGNILEIKNNNLALVCVER
jgi:tRNA(Ile)-lysidine synthase